MWVKNLKVLGVAILVLGFYTMVAHIIPQVQSEPPEAVDMSAASPEAMTAAGEKIFNGAGGCTACHGLGTRAPNLLTDEKGTGTIGVRCGKREAGKDCKGYLYESLTEPSKFLVPGYGPIMPDMRRQLSNDQIWAVVAFLESQGGEIDVKSEDIKATGSSAAAAPAAPAAAAGNSTDPMAIIRANGCLGCHSVKGEGAQLGPSFDHIGGQATAEEIRQKIVDPSSILAKGFEQFKGMMPSTFGQQLTAAQLEAVVKFLASHK